MVHARARKVAAAALLAFILSAGPAPAEVKLRIYLQDGSLQAGSLVTETPASFVLLTQEGRVEVPKNAIMFINGKTLKQWQDRPDKLFQTEIMPSDVPNPAFVNDKSLPPPPPAPNLATAPKPEKKRAVKAPPAVAEKKVVAPVVEEKKPAPAVAAEPRKSVPVAEAKPARRAKKAAPTAPPVAGKAVAPAPVAEAATTAPAKEADAPVDLGAAYRRTHFDRLLSGMDHHQKAIALEKQGEFGRAAQEYHIARLLEPGSAEVPLALGRLYLQQGLTGPARKFFSNPLLRRNAEATAAVARIDADRAAKEKAHWNFILKTIGGCFAWLPLIGLIRLLKRRRKKSRPGTTTINADDLRPEEVLPSVAELRSPVPEPVAEEPVAEELPAPEEPAMPEAPARSFPGLPEFLKNLTSMKADVPPVTPPPPAPEPVASEPEPIVFEAIEPDPIVEEPVVPPAPEPQPVAMPEPEPVLEPAMADARAPHIAPDPSEILSNARSVEIALIKGNAAAVEGKYEESRKAYRTALALNSSCSSAHLGLGYLAFVDSMWDMSLLHYRKALEIDPNSADAHYGVARVLLEINRVEDALPELRATLQIDPTYDDARDTLTELSKPA